jgi:hypothetical protein
MLLLDVLSIYYGAEERRIEIYYGDLTDLSPQDAVDVLVVSALPNDYIPTPDSLIGALDRKGISVKKLAQEKAADLRQAFSCWMSQEIGSVDPGIQFKRILCFEPLVRGSPPQVVGDIFRGLAPFMAGPPAVRSIAMPLVATGNYHQPLERIIEPLLDAAVHWIAIGFPLMQLKIVARSEVSAQNLKREFARLKEKYRDFSLPPGHTQYDVFISYSHMDGRAANLVVEELRNKKPYIRLFFDQMTLDTGVAWQQKIYEAIDASRRVLVLLSPSYIRSKVCLEEFNITLHRRRETGQEILFPIYLYSAALPTYMSALTSYEDCREGDSVKLGQACRKMLWSDVQGEAEL